MRLAKYQTVAGTRGLARVESDQLVPLEVAEDPGLTLSDILESEDPAATVDAMDSSMTTSMRLDTVKLLPPIDQQEVWAAGVTYKRSKTARMEESESAASCYDQVYQAARPELFFKAMPYRVVGPEEAIRIRKDSNWNVPEPELVLVLNSRFEMVGYTIGNDVSSRDIEGENPLYLPQAKVYDQSCALGPWITLASAMPDRNTIGISMRVWRDDKIFFEGQTSIEQMARSFEDLTGWLTRENHFPYGVLLMTGTGIVPDSEFTLRRKDVVEITIDGIGTLSNPVI